jgi:hypothetical protein
MFPISSEIEILEQEQVVVDGAVLLRVPSVRGKVSGD